MTEEQKKPTFRREIKNIVEFNLPSGPITIEHELGMIRIEDQSGGSFMFPDADLEYYIQALRLMAGQYNPERQ